MKDLIIKSSNEFNLIRNLSLNGKNFKGLNFPIDNKSEEIDSYIQKNNEFKTIINNQTYISLIENYNSYNDELKKYKDELIKIDSINNYRLILNKSILINNELSNEINKTNELIQKIILLKKGEFLNEKINILLNYYHSNIKENYDLDKLNEYLSQIKVLNNKINKIIESEEITKNTVKELKNLDNPNETLSIEKILLK